MNEIIKLITWTSGFSKFFHIPPYTLSIPPQQKSQKRQLQKFHITYCEETIDDYQPNKLFYNVSHCS